MQWKHELNRISKIGSLKSFQTKANIQWNYKENERMRVTPFVLHLCKQNHVDEIKKEASQITCQK